MIKSNLGKQSNFKIILKDQVVTEFLVQQVSIPGITLGITPIHWQSMVNKHPGDSFEWGNLSLTVISDEGLNAFKEAFRYIVLSHNPISNVLMMKDPIFDSKLLWTSNKSNTKVELSFYNCWIQSISNLQLSTTTSEDDPITFTIDIIYNYYIIGDNPQDYYSNDVPFKIE